MRHAEQQSGQNGAEFHIKPLVASECRGEIQAELETGLLEDALQMVRLYGEQADSKYAAACRRYLARWIVEESPSLEDIAATACHFVERGRPRLV